MLQLFLGVGFSRTSLRMCRLWSCFLWSLRVQVPNNHILTQNLYYNYYYPKPKYLIIGYLDPLGVESSGFCTSVAGSVLQNLNQACH